MRLKPLPIRRYRKPFTRAAGEVFYWAVTLAFALVALLSPNPPFLRDYGNWVYQGDLLARAIAGHPVALYQFKPYPVPNSLVTVALGVLTVAFGWLLAAKVWLAFSIVANSAALLFAGRAFRVREAALWWALPGAFLFGQSFWFATLSFNLGFSVLLILAVLLYRRLPNMALLVSLLLLCFFLHLIIYAAAFVLVVLYCAENRVQRPAWIALATMPLVVWYILGRVLTQSDESQIGHSSPVHIAGPILMILAALATAILLPAKPLARRLTPWLSASASLLVLVAVATLLFPFSRLYPNLSPTIATIRLKALAPFSLFGFINLMQTPANPPLSYSWVMLRTPLFLSLLAACFLAATATMIAIIRKLRSLEQAPIRSGDSQSLSSGSQISVPSCKIGFLWSFVALFASAYLICPPNALGVIGVDIRLGQLALGFALLLLARSKSLILRCVSPLFVALALASLFQFHVSQSNLSLPTANTGLPTLLANFGGIDGRYMDVYERFRTGNFGGFFFDTGLFAPVRDDRPVPAPPASAPPR